MPTSPIGSDRKRISESSRWCIRAYDLLTMATGSTKDPKPCKVCGRDGKYHTILTTGKIVTRLCITCTTELQDAAALAMIGLDIPLHDALQVELYPDMPARLLQLWREKDQPVQMFMEPDRSVILNAAVHEEPEEPFQF